MDKNKQHMRLVFQRLLKKCEFHFPSGSFLGFIIEQGQVKTDPVKGLAVAEWPTPNFQKQLQRWLSEILLEIHSWLQQGGRPLSKFPSSSSPLSLTPETKATFGYLKRLFTPTPVLTHPDPSRQFIFEAASPIPEWGPSSLSGPLTIRPLCFFVLLLSGHSSFRVFAHPTLCFFSTLSGLRCSSGGTSPSSPATLALNNTLHPTTILVALHVLWHPGPCVNLFCLWP